MSMIVKSMKQKPQALFGLANLSAFTCLLFLISLLFAQPSHAIKKCKSADGKWHYGDVAIRACEDSKITTLSDRGFVKEQLAAPKTEEELASEEAARVEIKAQELIKEEEELRIQAQEREDARILSIYETEADIDRQRDNQLYSVDSNIAVHNTYLNSMKELIAFEQRRLASTTNVGIKIASEKKIADAEKNYELYSVEVIALAEEREKIIKKFDDERIAYRKLTNWVDPSAK